MKSPSIMATSRRISNEKHVQGTPTVDKMYPTLQVCRTAFDLSPMFSHRHWVPARGMHFQTIRINDIIWWHTSFKNPWLTIFGHLAAKVPMHNFHTDIYIYIHIDVYRYIDILCIDIDILCIDMLCIYILYIYIYYMCVIHFFRLLNLHASICHKTRAPMTWLNGCLWQWDTQITQYGALLHYLHMYMSLVCSFPKFFDISNYWV